MIHYVGVIIGLAVAVSLIVKKLNPVCALFLGTIVGALVGGADLARTLEVIIGGSASVAGVIVRIVAGGVLAGVLIESGAAETIARTIVTKLGEKYVLLAIVLAGTILTAAGIFITAAIVILIPIALSVGKRANVSKTALLLALSGGAKAGNIISPNPNTVVLSEAFGLSVSDVMVAGAIPAVFGIVTSVFLASVLKRKGSAVADSDVDNSQNTDTRNLPPFAKAIVAPALAIALLIISPIGNLLDIEAMRAFQIDAFFILPFAAAVGAIVLGKGKSMLMFANSGIVRMTPIILILTGAGAFGRLITESTLPGMIVNMISAAGIPYVLLAPISGTLMASAAGSTVTGTILATDAFALQILAAGVAPAAAAVMVHTGAVFIDIMPHGNIFLASKEGMKMETKERLKLFPYEALVGGIMVVVSTILFGFIMG